MLKKAWKINTFSAESINFFTRVWFLQTFAMSAYIIVTNAVAGTQIANWQIKIYFITVDPFRVKGLVEVEGCGSWMMAQHESFSSEIQGEQFFQISQALLFYLIKTWFLILSFFSFIFPFLPLSIFLWSPTVNPLATLHYSQLGIWRSIEQNHASFQYG